MDNEDDIRVFLESPCTHELRSEPDIKAKPAPVKRRVRRERLPPYIPFKSIYEERDMSKLTERQRIMASKFQSMDRQPSSLFLVVNDIMPRFPVTAGKDKDEDKAEECLSKDEVKGCLSKDEVKGCPSKSCLKDGERLSRFLEWLLMKDNSRKMGIKSVLTSLNRLMVGGVCICSSEERIYKRVFELLV